MDAPEAAANLKRFKAKARRPVIPIAAELEDGLAELKTMLQEAVKPPLA
jgi:hypothetical protein